MNIVELLADDEYQTRVSCGGDRWLCAERATWKDGGIIFTVYEHKRYAKSTTTLIATSDEDEAVRALIGG